MLGAPIGCPEYVRHWCEGRHWRTQVLLDRLPIVQDPQCHWLKFTAKLVTHTQCTAGCKLVHSRLHWKWIETRESEGEKERRTER